jgi:hypothetical protein
LNTLSLLAVGVVVQEARVAAAAVREAIDLGVDYLLPLVLILQLSALVVRDQMGPLAPLALFPL